MIHSDPIDERSVYRGSIHTSALSALSLGLMTAGAVIALLSLSSRGWSTNAGLGTAAEDGELDSDAEPRRPVTAGRSSANVSALRSSSNRKAYGKSCTVVKD